MPPRSPTGSGQAHAGRVGPVRRRLHTGDGRAGLPRPVCDRCRGRPCRRGRESGVSGLGRDHPAGAGPRDVPLQGPARAARRRDRRRHRPRARQGALRCRGRARARHRGRRIRVRRPPASQERVHGQRRNGRRRVHDPAASGVVAGITPFNFPAMVPMWMFPMALVCGNAFVLKPSERDPSAALIMAALLKEAGLPDGVFNVVNGDKEAVDALLAHPDVQAVSFVGSTPIAKYIYTTGTAHGKRVQALGGAKNHAVVMPDADPEMGRRCAGRRRVRLGRRALHGDRGGGVRRRRRRRRRARPRAEQDRRDEGRRVGRPQRRDGSARHGRASRQGQGLHRQRRGGRRAARRRRPVARGARL